MGTSDYQHSHPLPRAVADAIYQTFEDLSDRNLLTHRLHGGTQNQNEAINALVCNANVSQKMIEKNRTVSKPLQPLLTALSSL